MRVFVATAALLASCAAAAAGDPAAGESKAAACFACHGPAGVSASPAFPVIAGQYPTYIEKALEQYKTGARKNPIMAGQAANLSEQDMKDLAAYFGAQQGPLKTPHYAAQ